MKAANLYLKHEQMSIATLQILDSQFIYLHED